jgi:hypothetical protein
MNILNHNVIFCFFTFSSKTTTFLPLFVETTFPRISKDVRTTFLPDFFRVDVGSPGRKHGGPAQHAHQAQQRQGSECPPVGRALF